MAQLGAYKPAPGVWPALTGPWPHTATVTLNGYEDTYLDSQNATTNNSASDALVLGNHSDSSASFTRRPLIRFDLTGIPAGVAVRSAVLRLVRHPTPSTGGASGIVLCARTCARAYVYTQATWNIYSTGNNWAAVGASGDADRGRAMWGSAAMSNDTAGTVYTPDIAPLVQSNAGSVLSLILAAPAGTESSNTINFCSSRHATTASRPTLTITYGRVGGVEQVPTVSATYIDAANPTTNQESVDGVTLAGVSGSTPSWDGTAFARHGLFDFSLGTVPSYSAIYLRLVMKANVTPNTGAGCGLQVRECLREYVASQATWNIYSTGNNWGTAGARNATDRGSTLSELKALTGTVRYGRPVFIDVTTLVAEKLAASATRVRLLASYLTSNNGLAVWDELGSADSVPALVFLRPGGSLPEYF